MTVKKLKGRRGKFEMYDRRKEFEGYFVGDDFFIYKEYGKWHVGLTASRLSITNNSYINGFDKKKEAMEFLARIIDIEGVNWAGKNKEEVVRGIKPKEGVHLGQYVALIEQLEAAANEVKGKA